MRIDRKLQSGFNADIGFFDRLCVTLGLPLNFLYIIFFNICIKTRIANTYVRNVHPSSIIPSFSYGIWLLIQSCVETDRTKINSPRLSIGWNLKQPKKSYELHEIIMLMSDSSSQRRRSGWGFLYPTYWCTLKINKSIFLLFKINLLICF